MWHWYLKRDVTLGMRSLSAAFPITCRCSRPRRCDDRPAAGEPGQGWRPPMPGVECQPSLQRALASREHDDVTPQPADVTSPLQPCCIERRPLCAVRVVGDSSRHPKGAVSMGFFLRACLPRGGWALHHPAPGCLCLCPFRPTTDCRGQVSQPTCS